MAQIGETLDEAILEIDAAPAGGSQTTGVFRMLGNLEVQDSLQFSFLLGSGRGSAINSVVSQSSELLGGQGADGAPQQRAGFYLDLGAGTRTFDLNFTGWEGSYDEDGNPLQWGDTGDETTLTAGDATGGTATQQYQCLVQYLRAGQFDSRSENMRLRFGEYRDGKYASVTGVPGSGIYDDYIHVVPQRSRQSRVSERYQDFDGTLTLVESESIQDPIDTLSQRDHA